ncbi:MAG: hypothetical protein JRG91_10890 [Deltaproteobacteria bacterium]|nr:hypothetical protein [Deltaproteobacteria bacterium]
MNEKLLLNLLYVLAAILFWLLPTFLRWLKRRKEAEAQDLPREPEPFPEVEELPQTNPLVDPFGEHLADLTALIVEINELAAEEAELGRACSGPGLARFNQLIGETVTTPLEEVRRAIQAGIDDPRAADPYRLIADSTDALMRMRAAAAFIARSVEEHRVDGHAERNARGVAIARIFLTRIEALLHKGAVALHAPLFLPVEQPALLHPSLLSTLAATRAVPFDASAGRSPSPRAWAAIARDVARWAYRRMPDLEPEIENHYAGLLEELGYQAALPPEGLAREVFIHALPALFLGPAYARATGSGAEGMGGEDIARRMLELADPGEADQGELPLPVEVMLHVLGKEPLAALSGSRLTDISSLRFTKTDGSLAAAAAALLLEGRAPEERDIHVVAGALLAALDHPQASSVIASAADQALGVVSAKDPWRESAPTPRSRRTRPAGFVSPRAVREAIVVGALMERR